MIKVTISLTLPDGIPEEQIIPLLKNEYLRPIQIIEITMKGKRVDLKLKQLDTTKFITTRRPGNAIQQAMPDLQEK